MSALRLVRQLTIKIRHFGLSRLSDMCGHVTANCRLAHNRVLTATGGMLYMHGVKPSDVVGIAIMNMYIIIAC